jgi:formylglycine-generating enzyme
VRLDKKNGNCCKYLVSSDFYFEELMMPHQKKRLTTLGIAAMMFSAVSTHAADSKGPEPVLMTEQALTAKQAQLVQKAWADDLGFDAVVENSIGLQLSLIPPGTFPMGKEDQKGEEGPQEVTHSQPYFIGRYEVTQGEWERVMGPLRWQRNAGVGDRFPIYAINYAEATEFCRKLTQLDREAGKLPEGYEYRLPTSAEWEYACRAGTLTATYLGDKLSSMQANFVGSYPLNKAEQGPYLGRTAEVGSYPANAWGLHDTYGNLYEWCLDWYHARAKGGVDPVHLLPAPERRIPERVRRGGCHSQAGRYCRSSNRYFAVPEERASEIGFRPVLSKLHLEGLHELTAGTHADFHQTRTRDGKNTRIWNRLTPKIGYYVMSGPVDRLPGESYAIPLTDRSHHTWAHTCLTDGRILVRSNPPNQELGYYLMTPHKDGTPKFERVQCDLATKGVLDRISLSPSETRVCFEFQTGFERGVPGRTLYVADFDAKQPAITDARPFANEDGKPIWYAWPRWSKDESDIVYQAGGKLNLYNLASRSTTKVATE